MSIPTLAEVSTQTDSVTASKSVSTNTTPVFSQSSRAILKASEANSANTSPVLNQSPRANHTPLPRRSILGAPPQKQRIKGIFEPLSRAFQDAHSSLKAVQNLRKTAKKNHKFSKNKFIRNKPKKKVDDNPVTILVDISDPLTPTTESPNFFSPAISPSPSSAQFPVEDLITFDCPDISDGFGDPLIQPDPAPIMEPTRTSLNC